MQGKDNGDGFIVLKLDHGEDLMACLRKAVADFNIKAGFVVTGIGMLRDAEIGYFDGKEYHLKVLEDPHELVTLQGSITTKGYTVIHLHCSMANKHHQIVGGHLSRGTVNVINEILIKKLDGIELGRNLNPETGLKELFIA